MKILNAFFHINYFLCLRRTICNHLFENKYIKKNISNSLNKNEYIKKNIDNNYYFILDKKNVCTNIIIIPMFKTNYSYIFYDDKDEGIVVDPSEYEKVIEVANAEKITIKNVLCTHKHFDHMRGNKYFYDKKINVYGVKDDENIYITNDLNKIKNFEINNFKIKTFFTNFHSINQVSYLIRNNQNKLKEIFFTGDFLFLSGIGKNFESNNEDMYTSINNLKKINKKTYIFCGHEYTLNNLKFALSIDSDNKQLQKYYEQVKLRNNIPTVPSLLEEEYIYNPFLRYDNENIKKNIEQYAKKNNYKINNIKDYLIILRIMKDNF